MSQETVTILMISIILIAIICILSYELDWKFLINKKKETEKKAIDGELIIDTTDPHKDVFRFELYYSPERLIEDKDQQYATFKIIRND